MKTLFGLLAELLVTRKLLYSFGPKPGYRIFEKYSETIIKSQFNEMYDVDKKLKIFTTDTKEKN